MNGFLTSIERQAYRIACLGTGDTDEAHDLVQDAMIRFVETYASKPREQWKPLFYRILHNRITDHHRRRVVRNRWFGWFTASSDEDSEQDRLQQVADPTEPGAERRLQLGGTLQELELALQDLPLRQRQVFLLRAWEELSVAETALAMNCSQGSVKTHYSRALERLRSRLGDHWP